MYSNQRKSSAPTLKGGGAAENDTCAYMQTILLKAEIAFAQKVGLRFSRNEQDANMKKTKKMEKPALYLNPFILLTIFWVFHFVPC